jgi:hypothetical protein
MTTDILPRDTVVLILSNVSYQDYIHFRQTCSYFYYDYELVKQWNELKPSLLSHNQRSKLLDCAVVANDIILLDYILSKYENKLNPILVGKYLRCDKYLPAVNIQTPELSKHLLAVNIQTPELPKYLPAVNIQTPDLLKYLPAVNIQTPDLSKYLPDVNIPTPKLSKYLPDVNIPTPKLSKYLAFVTNIDSVFRAAVYFENMELLECLLEDKDKFEGLDRDAIVDIFSKKDSLPCFDLFINKLNPEFFNPVVNLFASNGATKITAVLLNNTNYRMFDIVKNFAAALCKNNYDKFVELLTYSYYDKYEKHFSQAIMYVLNFLVEPKSQTYDTFLANGNVIIGHPFRKQQYGSVELGSDPNTKLIIQQDYASVGSSCIYDRKKENVQHCYNMIHLLLKYRPEIFKKWDCEEALNNIIENYLDHGYHLACLLFTEKSNIIVSLPNITKLLMCVTSKNDINFIQFIVKHFDISRLSLTELLMDEKWKDNDVSKILTTELMDIE